MLRWKRTHLTSKRQRDLYTKAAQRLDKIMVLVQTIKTVGKTIAPASITVQNVAAFVLRTKRNDLHDMFARIYADGVPFRELVPLQAFLRELEFPDYVINNMVLLQIALHQYADESQRPDFNAFVLAMLVSGAIEPELELVRHTLRLLVDETLLMHVRNYTAKLDQYVHVDVRARTLADLQPIPVEEDVRDFVLFLQQSWLLAS